MPDQFSRTRMLLGTPAMEVLARSRVAVFGVGGVGGYVVEALARSGVGALDLIDNDKVTITNLNRQIIALRYFSPHDVLRGSWPELLIRRVSGCFRQG